MILKTACIDGCKICDSTTTCSECNTNYKLADDKTCGKIKCFSILNGLYIIFIKL